MAVTSPYPVGLSIDYPDRQLNRLTTFFRIFTVIPIAIVLGFLGAGASGDRTPEARITGTRWDWSLSRPC